LDLALGIGVGAIVVVGVIVFLVRSRGRPKVAAGVPGSPVGGDLPAAVDSALLHAPPKPAEPLAMDPVTPDPLDVPEPSHLGEPPPPGLEVAPKIAAHVPDSSTLREHHRSASGHLRILFAKEMKPADTDETDPDDDPIA